MFPIGPKRALFLVVAFALSCTAWFTSSRAQADSSRTAHWLVPVQAPAFLVAEYQAPLTQYSSGHRGVDYSVQDKQVIYAPTDGVIAFAGSVALKPVLTIDHADGLRSAFEPACGKIPVGSAVIAGEPIGVVCAKVDYQSHCAPWLCLHFSVRRDGRYLSPRVFIGGLARAKLTY